MKSNRTRFVAALVVGSLAGILGVVLIIGYVSEAVVASAGEADKSLLYWYLPFFLFGGADRKELFFLIVIHNL